MILDYFQVRKVFLQFVQPPAYYFWFNHSECALSLFCVDVSVGLEVKIFTDGVGEKLTVIKIVSTVDEFIMMDDFELQNQVGGMKENDINALKSFFY